MKTTNKWGHYGLNIQVDTTFIMNEQYIYIYIYIYICFQISVRIRVHSSRQMKCMLTKAMAETPNPMKAEQGWNGQW